MARLALPQEFVLQKQWPSEASCGTNSVVVAADSLEELLAEAVRSGLFTLEHLEESVWVVVANAKAKGK